MNTKIHTKTTINIKPTEVYRLYCDFIVENDDKDPKFEVAGHVRISKYKSIFRNIYTPN